jgi:hypothetical protein
MGLKSSGLRNSDVVFEACLFRPDLLTFPQKSVNRNKLNSLFNKFDCKQMRESVNRKSCRKEIKLLD